MNAAFVLSGILLLLVVAGIFQGISEMNPRARLICAGLLALSPVGAIVCGTFTLESMMLHSLGFVLALGSPVVSFLVTGIMLRRMSRWRGFVNGLVLASPLTLVLFVLFFATLKPAASGGWSRSHRIDATGFDCRGSRMVRCSRLPGMVTRGQFCFTLPVDGSCSTGYSPDRHLIGFRLSGLQRSWWIVATALAAGSVALAVAVDVGTPTPPEPD